MKIQQLEMKGFLKNFNYIILCEKTKKAAVIDPGSVSRLVGFKFRRILKYLKNNKYDLVYIINTHRHFDHVKGNKFFTKKTSAEIISYATGLRENDLINWGNIQLKVIETPGHTADGICLYSEGNLFTGDTLFVGDSGATVSKDSDRIKLGASLRKLMELLPAETIVWPGHDFGKTRTTTLAHEKYYNVNSKEYRLQSD